MSTCNLSLYILEYRNIRVCDQQLDKVTLDPVGKIPKEKLKCIKWYFLNLSLLSRVNLPGEAQLTFTHSAVGNQYLGIPIL